MASMARDDAGNLYVSGHTRSIDFPATAGAYDTSHNGIEDAFVAKFDAGLTTLLAATYLGGAGHDRIVSLVLDSDGNVCVAGSTFSSDFPCTPGAHGSQYHSAMDVFIARLDPDLTTLLASTYLGGDGEDNPSTIAFASGALFLSGSTTSSELQGTPGAYDVNYNGGNWVGYGDAFIARLDTSLSQIEAFTFFGGSETEVMSFIAPAGNSLYMIGASLSTDLPAFPGAYDDSHNGELDVFVTRFDMDLTTLEAFTLLGGAGDDFGYCITLGKEGDVFIAGHVDHDFPVTSGAYDTTYNGQPGNADDVVICRLDADLTTLKASTFLGGDDFENCNSINIDSDGHVYVAGYSRSSDFPTTSGAYDETPNGALDAYVSKLDHGLSSLSASTLLGGNKADRDIMALIEEDGTVFVSGHTKSSDFPVTQGAYDTVYDYADVFVSKLRLTGLMNSANTLSAASGGAVDFSLFAGTEHAGRGYILLGSVSGIDPGYLLPGGMKILPLNWDGFTDAVVAWINTPLFSSFLSTLDASSLGSARLDTGPVPGFAGTVMHFAFALGDPFDFTSNAVRIEIAP